MLADLRDAVLPQGDYQKGTSMISKSQGETEFSVPLGKWIPEAVR